MLSFEKLPFYIGVLDSPDNKKLPLALPFALEFDKGLGLIRQRYSEKNEAFLDSAYKKGSSVSTPLGQGSFGVSRAEDVLKYIVKICGSNFKKSSFLEVGCGYGYLLHRLKLLEAKNVVGCDPGTDAKQGKKEFGINIINDFYKPDLINEKFDVILSFGFLEHVKKPLEIVRSFKKILKRRGKIFIAVPNCENKLKLGDISILGHEHWNFFTAKTLEGILIKGGLSNIKIAFDSRKAMIYGWGEALNHTENKNIDDSAELLFNNFSEKVKNILLYLQTKIDKLDRENKTLGLYAGGLQIIGLLKHKLEPRFFNGDVAIHGKYFPGYINSIESPENLITNKIDELWIAATDYDKEITNYLKYKLKIPKDTKIFSFKKYLEELK
ncbi:MAG: class I SAM-dependent methyltransferase [Candidatus Staskawiczbacteria bacterium]|jgi:2-polyprenyl-3-methyl-5-hydroxy-6-metoxy-1,4-benzoquinol methylase